MPRSKASRSRLRRRIVAGLAATLLLGLPAALLFVPRVPAVREGLLSAALRRAEESTGLALAARAVSMEPLGGRLVLAGVSAGLPGARPFLTAERVELELDVRAALGRRLHVRSVSVAGLRADLGAPLPVSKGPPATELPFLSGAVVDRIAVDIASIDSGPLPERLRPVALSARAGPARVDGSLRSGALRLRADVPSVVFERPGPLRVEGRADLALQATAGGEVDLESFHLECEGLSASAFGRGALSPDAPIGFRAEARVAPERVAPELGASGVVELAAVVGGSRAAPEATLSVVGRDVATPDVALARAEVKAAYRPGSLLVESARAELRPGGRVEGSGRLETATGEGTWTVRADGLPDALLDRFVSPAERARFGLDGGHLDLAATVRHGRGDPLPLAADAELSLSRAGTRLAGAAVRLEARGAATLDVEATILPDSPGERRAEGRLRAPRLAALSSGRLESGKIRVAVPDLGAAWTELRALSPEIVPETPEGVDLGGPLRLELRAKGPLRAPRGEVEASFAPAAGGAIDLRAALDGGRRSAEGRLSARGLAAGTFRPGATGLASADLELLLDPGRRVARVDLDAAGLCLSDEPPRLDALHAALVANGDELAVVRLAAAGENVPSFAGPAPARLAASGRLSLGEPLRDADLLATLSAAGLSAEALAVVRDGVLTLEVPRAGRPGLEATLTAHLPLGALRDVPALAPRLPPGLPDGPLEVRLDAPGLDTCALASLLPAAATLPSATGDVRAFATLPLADPLWGTAAVEVEGLSVDSPAGRLVLPAPARLALAGGRLALDGVAVEGEKTSFLVSAAADLLPGARSGAPLAELVSRVEVTAHGRAEAALLTPFLFGGSAQGEIAFDASASGPPRALAGHLVLDGTGSRLSWPLAYPTEVRDARLEADLTPGQASLTRGEALLNGGPVTLSGGWYGGVGTTLTARFSDVRYRLAYGLASVLSGELTLDVIGDERRISGEVSLDRGLLDRDVDLDREVLARVLAPPESPGTEASFLDTLALDLGIGTASGVRVRNNVADLSASWGRLAVTGTARRPVVRGRIDVERNGLVFAYGQTFRIDRGTVTYAGDPATDPRLDFVTTSSLQDRTIGARGSGTDVFAGAGGAAGPDAAGDDAAAELAHGLAGYYGDRLASRLGAALGRVSLAVRPLLLLGETDAAARLTLSREFSPNVSLAVGIDLKNAQRQTWIVDVHGLRRLPPLAAQVFTEDYGRWGGTLQQRIELGGARRGGAPPDAPRVAALRPTPPPGVSRRAFAAALRLRKGDPAGRDALFEAELDGETYLRGQGWPEAQVTLRAVPAGKAGRVDVEATVAPGPRVDVSFAGDRLPAAARRAVAGLYRAGLLEAESLEEMRREAVRSFRARGHLEPAVEVTAAGDEAERRVAVTARAGEKAAIREIDFPGVGAREAAQLSRRFATPLERVELAADLPSARARLLDGLRALGYPNARLEATRLSKAGRLEVVVDPGPASLVESVEVRSVAPEEAERLSRLVRLSPGDVADADRTAVSALAMEDALRAEGFAKARVRTTLSPATPEDPPRLAVVFDVERGSEERVGTIALEGFARTSDAWARRVAGLEPGRPFRREDLDAARGALFSLGLFSSVRGDVVPGADGRVDVVLSAEELPPVTLAYGLRWENEHGFSAVVDAADRNVLGRGLLLGVRALYDPGDRALRLFGGLPERVLGAGVDLWVERRRTFREGQLFGRRTDTTEASLQLSRSLGRLSARLYGRFKETRYFEDDPFLPLDVTIRLPYVGTQLVWDTREDPLLGTRGLFASVDLQATGRWLGSSYAYARAYGQANVYRPLHSFAAGRVVWAQSVRAGFARGLEGQELLLDARFTAGGSYSVRGYPTESLGPRQDLGGTLYVTGGSTLLVVNEELRVPLHPRLVGVAFFDAGQVWESSRDFGTGLAKSVGLGVRALTPLGVLRLDGAVPLDRREGDPSWRVTFGFGNVF